MATKRARRSSRKTAAQKRAEQREEQIQWITVVILFALAVIALLKMGPVGDFLYNLQRFLFGNYFYVVLGLMIIYFLIRIMDKHKSAANEKSPAPIILIAALFMLWRSYLKTADGVTGFNVLIEFTADISRYFARGSTVEAGGGLIGAILYAITSGLFGKSGTIVIMALVIVIIALLIVSLDVYKSAFNTIVDFFRLPEKEEPEQPAAEEPKEAPNLWKMIEEKKEKSVIGTIDPDNTGTIDGLSVMHDNEKKGKAEPVRQTPAAASSSSFITADGNTEEIDVYGIMGQQLDLQNGKEVSGPNSQVFINVDELMAQEQQPVPQRPQEPVSYEQMDMDHLTEGPAEESEPAKKPEPRARTAPVRPAKPYRLPPQSLLDPIPPKNANGVNERAAQEKGQLLLQILKNFDIDAQLIDTHIGPSVTQFEVRPDANVKVSKIMGLTDNIKMQLAATDIRIEAPIPGRNAVGIEVPNEQSTPVKMRELIHTVSQKDRYEPLLFFVGKDLLGETVTCRLDKMPHLLIAGATGSGKSVCMNSIITSLLLRTKPEEVKMLLIDPKKVEFTPYHNIPHLIGPVINDANQASNALKVIVRIMEERYNIFSQCAVRNISVYNEKVKNDPTEAQLKPMPYIVVIIDELADLMVVAGKEVESSIQRITQLARAAGIHLIVATQRPSTDVITGIIKANIPSRIAFSVSSGIDSRTILDHIGAERLLGNGDMLYMPIGQNAAQRVQGVFVTDEEVRRITDYCSAQQAPLYDDSFVLLEGVEGNEGTAVTTVSEDPLFREIKEYVIEAQKASTSLLQRRFGIGYNRAARMIDELEQQGIIGPQQGSKPREVYIKRES